MLRWRRSYWRNQVQMWLSSHWPQILPRWSKTKAKERGFIHFHINQAPGSARAKFRSRLRQFVFYLFYFSESIEIHLLKPAHKQGTKATKRGGFGSMGCERLRASFCCTSRYSLYFYEGRRSKAIQSASRPHLLAWQSVPVLRQSLLWLRRSLSSFRLSDYSDS